MVKMGKAGVTARNKKAMACAIPSPREGKEGVSGL